MSPIILAAALSAASSTAAAGRYSLIDAPGALYVTLKPQTSSLFGFLAHQHVVEARGYSGFVEYDPNTPSACRVEVDVPVAGLVVDRPEMREALGFDKDLSEGDRETVAEHMRAEDQLHAQAHDAIRFRGGSCEPLPDRPGTFKVEGELEIRGVKKTVRVPVTVSFEGDRLHAESDFSQIHESFGFEPYSAFGGTIKNAPMIRFHLRVDAER